MDQRYPVQVRARLDEPLSRWLWLVKWQLAIPHYIVLFFLWIAFAVVTVIAFFAILFTARCPARCSLQSGGAAWSWRVGYYTYSALGTDRYPPFSLDEEPDYPATLDVAYPERLSRGLVLVKWWLLAIPQYLVVGVFAGGAAYTASRGLGENVAGRCPVRRPDRAARVLRGHHAAVRRPLPARAVQLRRRHEPLGVAGHCLRRLDDRRLPAVPSGPGRAGVPAPRTR